MRYLVWSLNYRHDSAGRKVLHRLCHELNEAGQQAYVAFPRRNRAWNTPYHPGRLKGDWTAIYPEIVKGNPWRAPRVVRYVLNNPGRLGGDKTYDPSEIVYVYGEMFNDLGLPPDRILRLPAIELDLYVDHHEPRSGSVYYVGKGQKTRDLPEATEITPALKRNQALLAETLNRAKVMYTFDMATAMIDIARLCGCRVIIVPDGSYTESQLRRETAWVGVGFGKLPPPFDSDVIRQEQIALYETFQKQLAGFIDTTQS